MSVIHLLNLFVSLTSSTSWESDISTWVYPPSFPWHLCVHQSTIWTRQNGHKRCLHNTVTLEAGLQYHYSPLDGANAIYQQYCVTVGLSRFNQAPHSCPCTLWPSDIVSSPQAQWAHSDCRECFFNSHCYESFGSCKKSPVFLPLQQASESSPNGKMETSADWETCGHSSSFFKAKKGKR